MNDHSAKVFALLSLLMTTVGFWLACIGYDYEMFYGAAGMTALAIVAVPMIVRPRIDWFSPWTFVVVTVALGCAARGICMSFRWPDEYQIDFLFLLGEDPQFFVLPTFYLLLGLSCLSLGYFQARFPSAQSNRQLSSLRWNGPRMNVVLGVVVVVSVLATIQYIRNTGGFASGVLSGKRTLIYDIDVQGDSEFNQYGYLRQTAKLANFAYLTLLGYSLFYVRRLSLIRLAVLGVLLVLACILPFYSSSRLPIVWTFCGSGALLWYSGRHVTLEKVIPIACLGMLVFIGMTVIRGKQDAGQHLRDATTAESLVDGLVIHRNFMGIAKTAHIINAVPSELNYQYGKSIGVWALSPIPRRLWANKPMVHTGPLIGHTIYGNNVSGVPPGMIAELYWNFHLFGVVIGSFLLGTGLRWIGEVFRPRPGKDLPLALVYVIGPMRLGCEIAGNSVGFGLMKVLVDSVSMALILLLVLDRRVVISAVRRPSVPKMKRAA